MSVDLASRQSKPEHEAASNEQSELMRAMAEVLECLKKHGQRLDLEIARELKMPLATVRERIADLAATGAIITCRLTRFEGGKRINAWQCRVSGYVPPQAPGRKAKPTA